MHNAVRNDRDKLPVRPVESLGIDAPQVDASHQPGPLDVPSAQREHLLGQVECHNPHLGVPPTDLDGNLCRASPHIQQRQRALDPVQARLLSIDQQVGHQLVGEQGIDHRVIHAVVRHRLLRGVHHLGFEHTLQHDALPSSEKSCSTSRAYSGFASGAFRSRQIRW